MFYKLIEKKRNEWLVSGDCTIQELLRYIEKRNMMRDAQLEAIKTYLYLNIAHKNQPLWKSDAEIKIDRLGYVILNGKKTLDFWDATIKCDQKPQRKKIRNICGDETVFIV